MPNIIALLCAAFCGIIACAFTQSIMESCAVICGTAAPENGGAAQAFHAILPICDSDCKNAAGRVKNWRDTGILLQTRAA